MTVKDILKIVIPCYNEEDMLLETSKQLKKKMSQLIANNVIDSQSKITFVNDGSNDSTWEIITKLINEDTLFEGINLAHNSGHQHALLAGMLTIKDSADMIISMDADLQDDINAIDEMVEQYYMGVEIVFNHADYRLMSKRAVDELSKYEEVNTFLRGIIPTIGLKHTKVYYDRKERIAGESKYPLNKMLEFAFEGITSFSIKPIRLITMFGFFLIVFSVIFIFYSLIRYFQGNIVSGWTSIILSIWLVGGSLMLSLGIIGEYIGKIYLEVKKRPRFIIMEYLKNDDR